MNMSSDYSLLIFKFGMLVINISVIVIDSLTNNKINSIKTIVKFIFKHVFSKLVQ